LLFYHYLYILVCTLKNTVSNLIVYGGNIGDQIFRVIIIRGIRYIEVNIILNDCNWVPPENLYW